MPSSCVVCKKVSKGKTVAMYHFPSDPVKHQTWLKALNMAEEDVKEHHRLCSCHFPNGDNSQPSSLHLGERFASPKKMHTPRAVRAARNAKRKEYLNLKCGMKRPSSSLSPTPCTSRAVQ